MAERKNPPLLMSSPLTGRVFIVTRYTKRRSDGLIAVSEKFDVTEQFEAMVQDRMTKEGE
jgi:hypothetical protein